jgi:transposase
VISQAPTTTGRFARHFGVRCCRSSRIRARHPFYTRLNRLLREHGFDEFAEAQCATFYAETMGRPSLPPGIYFRLLLIGYFEGIDSERGIVWPAADSFGLRDFLAVGPEDAPPDHSTITRTRPPAAT